MLEVNRSVIIFESASDIAYYSTTTLRDDVKFLIFSMCVFYILLYFIIHVVVLMC